LKRRSIQLLHLSKIFIFLLSVFKFTLLLPSLSRVYFYGNNFVSDQIIDSIFNNFNVKDGIDSVIKIYLENGFPFISLEVDSVLMRGDADLYFIRIKENGKYFVDHIENVSNVKNSFLNGSLRLKNKIFNEKYIKKKLKELDIYDGIFVDTIFDVCKYSDTSVVIKTNIIQGKMSSVSGILSSSLDTFKINGFLNILLKSPFGNFDTYSIDYQRIKGYNSFLDVYFEYPYLFSLPTGIFGNLSFQSIDTTYNIEDFNFGFKIFFTDKLTLTTGYGQKNVNYIKSDSTDLKENYISGGLEYKSKNLLSSSKIFYNFKNLTNNWTSLIEKGEFKNFYRKIGYSFTFDSYLNFSDSLKDYMKIFIGGNKNIKGYPEDFTQVYNFIYGEFKIGYLTKQFFPGLFLDFIFYNIENINIYNSYRNLLSYGIFLIAKNENYQTTIYYALNRDISIVEGRVHLIFSVFF